MKKTKVVGSLPNNQNGLFAQGFVGSLPRCRKYYKLIIMAARP